MRKKSRPIWSSYELFEVFKPNAFVERQLSCNSIGAETISYEIVLGVLPPGLSMSKLGLISGTPVSEKPASLAPQLYAVIVRATNEVGSTDRQLTLVVAADS